MITESQKDALVDDKQYSLSINERTLTPAAFGGQWLSPRSVAVIVNGACLKALLASDEGVKVVGFEEV